MGALRSDKSDLVGILRDYENRMQSLETGQRAGHTSIANGGITDVRNSNGVQVVNIGTTPVTGGYGIELSLDGTGGAGTFVNVGTDLKSLSTSIANLQTQINTLTNAVNNLQSQINGKANASHTHTGDQIFTVGAFGTCNHQCNLDSDLVFIYANRNAP